MSLKAYPSAGTRVAYARSIIDDVPKGSVGTVVALTKPDGGSIIVSFDGIPAVRYLKKVDLGLVRDEAP